jgi:outer membrane protein TolC
VADNFYQVGMTPLNDLLQAQVELANAKQELIVAKNNLDNAESNFNTLLRRPINTPVVLKDILDYSPFEETLEYCLSEAEKNRIEIKMSDMEIEISQKEIQLAKKDYYPSIDLKGNYFNYGTEWDVDGGEGIYDPTGWNIQAVAKWNFWEWGRTSYGVKEKHSRLAQAQLQKKEIFDNIHLEVKTAYLRTQEAERAIKTVETAIEQAKENYRINQERYKEQISTQTDVLIAQTLLTRTMTNYYNALYAFKISKATLYRSIGQEVIE